MATGLVQTPGLLDAPFAQWTGHAFLCPVPVRTTDLTAGLVYVNAAWHKVTNLDQARHNGLGWLDGIQTQHRTEVLIRLLDPKAQSDGASLVYATIQGPALCETLAACHGHQGRGGPRP